VDGRGLKELQTHVFGMLEIVESVLFPPPVIDEQGSAEAENA
jgi:hypothetical protein